MVRKYEGSKFVLELSDERPFPGRIYFKEQSFFFENHEELEKFIEDILKALIAHKEQFLPEEELGKRRVYFTEEEYIEEETKEQE